MSTIESAAATLGATSTSPSKTRSEEDFDSLVGTREDFLTILLAQLKFQDPLDPMEGTEFIDSITRLSSVEQSINQNAHLEEIESLLKAERDNFGSPVSYLDKEIEFSTYTRVFIVLTRFHPFVICRIITIISMTLSYLL